MGYSKKLKSLLLLIAVLPPIIIISILNFSTEEQLAKEQKKQIEQSIAKADAFLESELGKLRYDVQQFAKDSLLHKQLYAKKRREQKVEQIVNTYEFRFLYITDNNGKVLYSFGDLLLPKDSINNITNLQNKDIVSKEVDLQGNHISFTYVAKIDKKHFVYAGKYVDQSIIYLLTNISDAEVQINFDSVVRIDQLNKIVKTENGFKSVILSAPHDSITIILNFDYLHNQTLFTTVQQVIVFVSLFVMILAIITGLYFAGKIKKEIDNLRTAFSKVADGDFDTPVMAYEQSEFSELADSFSTMVTKLKTTQTKLSTVEKIAAWETVGRKLAHEIKNPLSPISIAADDLRSSYYEKLPNFDKIIDESTSTIKKEVKRMTILLDEFVSFARMKQSDLQMTNIQTLLDDLQKLYATEISENKISFAYDINAKQMKLDKDTLTQVFINLIKNGFESKADAKVDISIEQAENNLVISISDNGPGFSDEKLQNSFKPFDTTKQNGTGLGLIICHRIILDHDGMMLLENKTDGGGRVVITLPIT